MTSYELAFPVLQQVYLEDSFVESVTEVPGGVLLVLDAVVTEQHPEYRGPLPGHQYDYRRLELAVVGTRVVFAPSGAPATRDLDGSLDHGNVDVWTVDEAGWSHLEGDWGTADVLAARPVLRWLDGRAAV